MDFQGSSGRMYFTAISKGLPAATAAPYAANQAFQRGDRPGRRKAEPGRSRTGWNWEGGGIVEAGQGGTQCRQLAVIAPLICTRKAIEGPSGR